MSISSITYSQQYKLENLGFDDGLVSAGVDGILFDEQGYLWLGGDNDLCRYDGINLIKCDITNGWPVSSGWVYNIALDGANNLWVSSTDTCLFVCMDKNKKNKKFIFYNAITNPLKVIIQGNKTWVLTEEKLFVIANYQIQEEFKLPTGVNIARYNPIAAYNNKIYIATIGNGLLTFDKGTKKINAIHKENGLSSDIVNSVHLVGKEMFIVHDSSVTVFDNDNYNTFYKNNTSHGIKYVFKDNSDQIWMVGRKGILVFHNGKLKQKLSMDNNAFDSDEFTFGTTDNENNIWLASATNGIYEIRNLCLTRFGDVKKAYSPVYGISQDKQNKYWFGYYNARFITRLKFNNEGLPTSDTLYVPFDPTLNTYDSINDRIWYSGYNGVMSFQGNEMTSYSDMANFTSDKLWNTFYNPLDTSVYFTGSVGVTQFKNNQFTKILPKDTSAAESDIFIYDGTVTSHGIYLATKYGIKKIEDHRIVSVKGLDQGKDARAIVIIIASDRFQNVWSDIGENTLVKIGIDKNGRVYNKKYNLFNLFGIKSPFNICIKDNYFALRTFSELYVMDLKSIIDEKPTVLKKIDQSDGLHQEAPQYQEMFFDHNNSIWVCGGYGAYSYAFLDQKKNNIETINHIQQIKINGKALDLEKFCSGYDSVDELPIGLKLPYTNNEITFEYQSITYKGYQNVFYKTRLLGLQNEWSAAFQDRHITYNNLSPGTYTFQFISCNNDRVWNKIPYSFSFKIKPPWYKTIWFRLLSAILLGTSIYIIFLLRISQLRKAKKRQENLTEAILQSQEEERKRIAQDLHDGVGQKLSMLKVKAEKEKNEPMKEKVSNIIEDIRLLSRNIHPHYFEKLGLTKAIEILVEENKQLGDIYWASELENIDNCFNSKQQLIIFRIMQECMNNILKHSHAKNAKITFEKMDNQIHINIQDNGVGFDLDVNKINSLGLSTIRERIRSLNGSLSIKTKPGQGTHSIIVIPIVKNQG